MCVYFHTYLTHWGDCDTVFKGTMLTYYCIQYTLFSISCVSVDGYSFWFGIFEVFVEDSNPGDGFGWVRVRSAYERVYRESLYRIKRYMQFQIGLSCTNIECVSSLRCYLYSSKWDNNGSLRTLNSTQTVWITLAPRKSFHKVFNVKYTSKVWKYINLY